MKIVKTVRQLRSCLALARKKGKTVGFVPTMGFFHEGHLSLMETSRQDNHITVVSIFVNPLQFGPQEDLEKYPRDIERDCLLARKAGVDVLFVPENGEMYMQGSSVFVDVGPLGDFLCGASRPGHFRGVATVVAKLLNIVQPDTVYLGQKDAQQVEVIKRMMAELNFPSRIKVCPTVREKDGLAMSSRNRYLSPSERAFAPVLYRALVHGSRMIGDGERNAVKIISKIKKLISDGTGASIDYVSCVGLDGFNIVRRIKGDTLIAVAARIGSTRLIDNIVVKVK